MKSIHLAYLAAVLIASFFVVLFTRTDKIGQDIAERLAAQHRGTPSTYVTPPEHITDIQIVHVHCIGGHCKEVTRKP